MLQAIGMTVLMIAALYGLGDWIRRLMTCLLFPPTCLSVRLLLLDDAAEQVEYAVRGWLATRERERLVLVDRSLTDDGKALARRISEKFSFPLCCPEELPQIVLGGLQDEENGV